MRSESAPEIRGELGGTKRAQPATRRARNVARPPHSLSAANTVPDTRVPVTVPRIARYGRPGSFPSEMNRPSGATRTRARVTLRMPRAGPGNPIQGTSARIAIDRSDLPPGEIRKLTRTRVASGPVPVPEYLPALPRVDQVTGSVTPDICPPAWSEVRGARERQLVEPQRGRLDLLWLTANAAPRLPVVSPGLPDLPGWPDDERAPPGNDLGRDPPCIQRPQGVRSAAAPGYATHTPRSCRTRPPHALRDS